MSDQRATRGKTAATQDTETGTDVTASGGDAMGSHVVTSADVAHAAGVSRSTVSRCMADDPRISEATRERVQTIAAELGYHVNKIASSMNRRKSDLIGLVTSGLSDPFRIEFLDCLIGEIQQSGYRPLVIDVSDPAQMGRSMLNLLQYQVAGVVVTSGSPSPEIGTHYLRRNVPVVLVNRAGRLEGADVINCDNVLGGRLAADHFLATGKKRLAFLNVRGGTYSGNVRGESFVSRLAPRLANGDISFRTLVCDSADYDGGFAAGLKYLDEGDAAPDAIFCAKDHIALGLLDAARFELGLKVPDDVSVIGFDDIVAARQGAYQLTTIRQSPRSLAKMTVDRLHRRVGGESLGDERLVLPVDLVVRKTA